VTEFIADIYTKNSQSTSKYYGICQKFARISKWTIQVGLAVYVVIIATVTLSGSIESVLTGVYKPTLYIYFPMIREYSTVMTIVSFVFNHATAVACIFAVSPGDMFFFLVFANMPMIPSIIKGQLEELTETLQKKDVNVIEIKHRIVQYIRMQRIYNELVVSGR
jgi:hypothetical protein